MTSFQSMSVFISYDCLSGGVAKWNLRCWVLNVRLSCFETLLRYFICIFRLNHRDPDEQVSSEPFVGPTTFRRCMDTFRTLYTSKSQERTTTASIYKWGLGLHIYYCWGKSERQGKLPQNLHCKAFVEFTYLRGVPLPLYSIELEPSVSRCDVHPSVTMSRKAAQVKVVCTKST